MHGASAYRPAPYFAGNDSGSGNNVLFTYDGSALPSPAMGIDGPPYNPAYLTQLFAVLGEGQERTAQLFMSGTESPDSNAQGRLYRYDCVNNRTTSIPPPGDAGAVWFRHVQLVEAFSVNKIKVAANQPVVFFSGVMPTTTGVCG